MDEVITVRVHDLVGPLCVSARDGQRLHSRIRPLLAEGRTVALSFERVDTMISAFLNAAIGQLYGEFDEDQIKDLLSVHDLEPDDQAVLHKVVENAKLYFESPREYDQAWDEELGDDDE